MESLTTPIIFPQNSHLKLKLSTSNFLHFQLRFYSIPRRFSFCRAIRNPKFDFNLRSFNFDDDDVKGRRRYRRRRKSDRRLKQRKWWKDEEDEGNEIEKGVWEEVVDSLWIFQVFRAYGWFSPIILLSFLIATGPKAFLMAFSIPFGVSLLIFAYQKVQGWQEGSSKPWNRRKRRPKFGRRNDASMEEDDDEEERQPSQRNKKKDYQSWVNRSNGSFYNSQNGSGANETSFGGWDDLVRDDEIQRARNPSGETVKPDILLDKKLLNLRKPSAETLHDRKPSEETLHERKPSGETVVPEKLEERFSRLLEEKDLPVMLKLLIAVFPFLASWTNFL